MRRNIVRVGIYLLFPVFSLIFTDACRLAGLEVTLSSSAASGHAAGEQAAQKRSIGDVMGGQYRVGSHQVGTPHTNTNTLANAIHPSHFLT